MSEPDPLVSVYQDLHRHPELAFHETRTASIVASWLDQRGFDVTTGIGRTGVAGLLRNGAGPTALLRADLDALPVLEQTGLPTRAPRWAAARMPHDQRPRSTRLSWLLRR
jgi:metal-dependent amidase/aminoacylase/carboxypeptidase family protein